jgi:hypothetical protein
MAKDVSIFDGTAWVSIVGPAGKDGVDGKDGSGVDIKGTATVYPPDAAPTAGDMWIVADPVPAGFPPGTEPGDGLVWTGTAWNNVGGIRGPAGKDGADGADGAPGQDGQAGADGVGFAFKGEWDAGGIYVPNDVVTFNGTTYIYVTGSGDEETSDTSAWSVLSPPGADGAKGDKGDKGDPGADGAKGTVAISTSFDADLPTVAEDGNLYLETGNQNAIVSPDGAAVLDCNNALISVQGSWVSLKGNTGADGAKGDKGDTGDDGRSVAVTVAATQPATAAIGDFWIQPT